MKKAIVLLSALFLIAGMALAQTPQTPAKSTTTTTEKKDSKATCDPKTAKNCPASKSCCAHDSKAASSGTEKKEAAPEKK